MASRALVVLLAISLASGCGTSVMLAWPRADRTAVREVEDGVDVTSEPEGAEVVDEDGQVLGRTPYHHRVTYEERRSWRERRIMVPGAFGISVSLSVFVGAFLGAATVLGTDNPKGRTVLTLTSLATAWDLGAMLVLFGLRFPGENDRARRRAEPVASRYEERLTVRWPGGGGEQVLTLEVPGAPGVAAVRPLGDDFDLGLLAWADAREGAPPEDPDVRYQLARARVARAADEGSHRELAAEACRAFLAVAGTDDARRAEVLAWLSALEGGS